MFLLVPTHAEVRRIMKKDSYGFVKTKGKRGEAWPIVHHRETDLARQIWKDNGNLGRRFQPFPDEQRL